MFILPFLATVLASPIEKRAGSPITASQYADLVRYVRYAAAAYNTPCASPNGAQLISAFNNDATDTQGYVAYDPKRVEIVVAFRGTSDAYDFYTDSQTTLIPCQSTGVAYPGNTKCHTGFQNAYNSVSSDVLAGVRKALSICPLCSIKVTGHSLGGGLSSLGGLSIKANFPGVNVVGYSYGQPRTGDYNFAAFHDSQFPVDGFGRPTFLRAIHTTDGVPQVIRAGSDGTLASSGAGLAVVPNNLNAKSGYRHHGTEFWQTPDPASQQTTRKCQGQEDPQCQDGVYILAPAFGINYEHIRYFNMNVGNPLIEGDYCTSSS